MFPYPVSCPIQRKVYLTNRRHHFALLSCQGQATSNEANSSRIKTTATAIYFVYASWEALIGILDVLSLIFTTITHGEYHGPCFTEKY